MTSVRLACFVAAAVLLAACGGGGSKEAARQATETPQPRSTLMPTTAPATPTPKPAISFTNENWGLALADPAKYKGSRVVLVGKAFTEPEISQDLVCFQMYTDPENSEGNTAVCASANVVTVASKDYIKIEGTLVDKFEGTNLFGAKVTIPLVAASKLDKVTRSEVVAPALVVVEPNSAQTQHGLTITLNRVEIAKTETRVWVTVSNAAVNKASAYDFGALLVQGNRQFETKYAFDTGLPELPGTVLPGVEASGVILFEAIDPAPGQARLVWDGPRTEDYSLDFADWVWDFSW